MKIRIDKSRCIGCGLCRNSAPTLFYINGYHAETFADSEDLLKEDELLVCRLSDIIETCPAQAISVEEEAQQDNGCHGDS
jgi:ferredoxin